MSYDDELCAIYGKSDDVPDSEEPEIDGWTPSAVNSIIKEELGVKHDNNDN